MTDNRTTELREKLTERGIEWISVSDTCTDISDNAQIVEYKPGVFGVQMRNLTPEQAIAATLGRPTWRNSYDQQRYDQWYDSLFHGEPSSFKELIEDVIWTTETVDLGPNGNECQGVDEGEVNTESLIESWAKRAATLGSEREKELEELVRDMNAALIHDNCYRWCEAKEPCNLITDGKCQYRERIRELGIEVVTDER